MSDHLPAVVVAPRSGKPQGALIWLHGLGADGHDFVPALPALPLEELGLKVVLPHAPARPVTINGGLVMPAWYDITGVDLEDRQDEEGVRASAKAVESLVAREVAGGIPSERIALVGFSQGGAVALFAGLRHRERLAGVAALSTYLILGDALERERSPTNGGLPVFHAHGRFDPVVRLQWGELARDWLRARGHPVDWHVYPMEHAVCPEELADLGRWLATIFSPR
ncbi:MAG: carboxylesterase [Planctomycetota bacterium]|nr:MAG: carboxylesterase [Planctomycetota bacterium]